MNKILEYMAVGLPIVSFDLREARVSAGDAARYASCNDTDAVRGGSVRRCSTIPPSGGGEGGSARSESPARSAGSTRRCS